MDLRTETKRWVDALLAGKDPVLADAEGSLNRTPEERYTMWVSVQRMVSLIWSSLSEEETRKKLEIAEKLDPRPDPWWRNIRPEALP